jgi:hypothetical protein
MREDLVLVVVTAEVCFARISWISRCAPTGRPSGALASPRDRVTERIEIRYVQTIDKIVGVEEMLLAEAFEWIGRDVTVVCVCCMV